jgi:hypothetical protein
MKTKLFTTSLAVFFLVLFTSTKVFGFHEFLHSHEDHHHHSHHNHNDHPEHLGQYGSDSYHDHPTQEDQENDQQEEDCDFCDKILLDFFSPYGGDAPSDEAEEIPQQFFEYSIEEYTSQIHITELTIVLFSRPPPRFM